MAENAKKTSNTPEDIVGKCNELARLFYAAQGYQVEEGYRFDEAHHPHESGMWALASIAFDFIEGTDCDAALDEIDE